MECKWQAHPLLSGRMYIYNKGVIEWLVWEIETSSLLWNIRIIVHFCGSHYIFLCLTFFARFHSLSDFSVYEMPTYSILLFLLICEFALHYPMELQCGHINGMYAYQCERIGCCWISTFHEKCIHCWKFWAIIFEITFHNRFKNNQPFAKSERSIYIMVKRVQLKMAKNY